MIAVVRRSIASHQILAFMNNRLLRDCGGLYLVKIAGGGLAFGLQVVLARGLGVEGFGLYSTAFAWLSILLLVARQGFDVATLKFVPAYFGREEWPLLRGYLRLSRGVVLGSSFLVGALFATGAWFWAPTRETQLVFIIAAAALPIFAIGQLLESILRSLRRVVTAPMFLVIAHPALVIAIFASIPGDTAIGAMSAYLTASVLCLAGLLVMYRRVVSSRLAGQSHEYATNEWLRTSWTMILVMLSGPMINHLNIVLITAFENEATTGLFSAAARIVSLLQIFLISITSAYSPRAAALYAKEENEKLRKMTRLAARVSFAGAVVLGGGILLFGKLILSLLGSEFTAAFPALAILIIGQIAFSFAAPALVLLNMTGYHSLSVKVLMVGTVANITLCAGLLSAGFGIIGAALASAVTTATIALTMAYFTSRHLGIHATPCLFQTREYT